MNVMIKDTAPVWIYMTEWLWQKLIMFQINARSNYYRQIFFNIFIIGVSGNSHVTNASSTPVTIGKYGLDTWSYHSIFVKGLYRISGLFLYPVSGWIIGRISRKISIRYNPVIWWLNWQAYAWSYWCYQEPEQIQCCCSFTIL